MAARIGKSKALTLETNGRCTHTKVAFWRGNEDWPVSLEELKEYRDERPDEEWYMEEDME